MPELFTLPPDSPSSTVHSTAALRTAAPLAASGSWVPMFTRDASAMIRKAPLSDSAMAGCHVATGSEADTTLLPGAGQGVAGQSMQVENIDSTNVPTGCAATANAGWGTPSLV